MTTHDDLDRQLNAFLREGPTDLPDPSFDAVRDRTEHTRQRAVIGSWSVPDTNKFVMAGLGIAAVVAVLVIGINQLGWFGGPAPGGEPSPSVVPSEAEPSVPGPSEPSEPEPSAAALPEGPWILVYPVLFGVETTVTIPAPDWYGLQYSTRVDKHGEAGPPEGAGLTVYGGDLSVYGDPCAWESTRPDSPAASLDELVAALSAQASRDATPPVDVTVGGFPGAMLTLHVPEDAAFGDCDGGEFRTLLERSLSGDETPHTAHAPGQISEVWVVDVDGTLVFFDAGYYAATPVEFVEEMRTMVESAMFD